MKIREILNTLSLEDRERLYNQLNNEFGNYSSAIKISSEINPDKK